MDSIEKINSNKPYEPRELNPEEIELLKQSKKDISDKVMEMIKNDPMLFKSE